MVRKMTNNIRIGEAPKEDKRIDAVFMNKKTRDLFNVELGEELFIKGTEKSLLLPVLSSSKVCQDNTIHLNQKFRNKLGKYIIAKKPPLRIKILFTLKRTFIIYISGVATGIIANWVWSLIS